MKEALHIGVPIGWRRPLREVARKAEAEPERVGEPVVWILMVVTLGLIAAAAYLLWAKVSSVWPFL